VRRTPSTVRVKPAGLVVAAVGFLLTRYVVASSLRTDIDIEAFLVAEAPMLVVGLGLSVAGVVLTVGPQRPAYVRTIVGWCLAGVAGTGLVVGLTVAGNVLTAGSMPGPRASFVPRVLLGGAVGGTLTGVYAARAAVQRRSLADRTDRLTVLNRLLRHEVLNKLTVIRGYADLEHPDSAERVRRNTDRIESAIDHAGVLARDDRAATTLDLTEMAARAVEAADGRYPETDVTLDSATEPVTVWGSDQLDIVLAHLIDNAVEHGEGESVRVTVGADETSGWVSVADDGPGLPAEQQAALRSGTLPTFDDPATGFGLTITRLLVDEAEGELSTSVDDGTTVSASFRRVYDDTPDGVSRDHLAAAGAASLVAGAAMGLVYSATTGSIPVIGALYGAENAVVGWTTHQFHSVVFGLGFVAAVSHPRFRGAISGTGACVAAGVAYGLLLAALAAGVVMPLWLQAIGIPATVPNVSAVGVASHALWGAVLSATFEAWQYWRG